MKKFLSAMSAAALALCICTGCSGGTESVNNNADNSYQQSESAAPSGGSADPDSVVISQSPDKYTYYIKNYVGRNLSQCGESYSSGLEDSYGEADVELVIITDDGSYFDVSDEERLKNYVVTGQGVAPNTEMKVEYDKYPDGSESDWVSWQSIEEIELYVSPVAGQNN